jgi:Arc/MetJ-type ribon-helix-helix transcriptional regulator
MTETEKITINISPVDLGKIDLLVEQGFYSNRTDFIRAAIRRQLDSHEEAVEQTARTHSFAVGVVVLDRKELEARAEGGRLTIRVIGTLIIADDVSPELARKAIDHVKIHGVLRASPEVREALEGRID